MADVFISYRHISPDQDLAARIGEYLAKCCVSHFIDTNLRAGEEWVKVIERELSACQSLVVLLSASSIRSDMVRHEVKLAHNCGKRIVPIRVDYDGALPYDLGAYLDQIHYKIWREGEPFDSICSAVLDGVRGVGEQEAAEPSPEALRQLGEVTELRGAPLPQADPRLETGAVKLDSPFYVRRPADDQLHDMVHQSGETILVKGPRQVGKTSLAARAMAAAQANQQQACYIDFQLIDESRFRNSGTLLQYIAARLAKDFSTKVKPRDMWDDALGDADSLTAFIEEAVLAPAHAPILVCFDEVDNVFGLPFRDSFFGMLRGWHNRRATHTVWNKFNLLIAHSTEPALFIRDLNQSPFNVGTVVRLGDFGRDAILRLNLRHRSPLKEPAEVDCLIRLLGGHPYLIRQAMYALATTVESVMVLERISIRDDGPFGDHLRRLLWVLRNNEDLRKALKQVLAGRDCPTEDDFQRLRAAGILNGESRQTARSRCELYVRYLKGRL